MHADFTGIAYLVAAICFIMALRGLSSPETARRGNAIGIAGMAIAIVTTLADPGVVSFELIAAGVVIGGAIGTVIALRIQMTALPQLVAAFHSLVGLAAVAVATAAFYAPEAYGIGTVGDIKTASLIEMAIGTAVGAVTFTGSVVAFAKLQGLVSGAPLVFKGQHPLNAGLGVGAGAAGRLALPRRGAGGLLADRDPRAGARLPDHRAHRRRRHAGGDLDAELLFRLGGVRDRLHAVEHAADHHRRAGRLVGRDPELHHVPRHEPVVLQRHPRRVRGRGRDRRRAATTASATSRRAAPRTRPSCSRTPPG